MFDCARSKVHLVILALCSIKRMMISFARNRLLCWSHQPTDFQMPLKSPIEMFEHDDEILHYLNLINIGYTIEC